MIVSSLFEQFLARALFACAAASVMGCANAQPMSADPVAPENAFEHPAELRDLKSAVWSRIDRFADDDRRDLFDETFSVAEQIRRGSAVPDRASQPRDGARVGPDWIFLTGCRPHYCPEKAAVVAREDGEPVGAGVIYYPSSGDGSGQAEPHLFLAAFSEPTPQAATALLEGWARGHFESVVVDAPIVYRDP